MDYYVAKWSHYNHLPDYHITEYYRLVMRGDIPGNFNWNWRT